MISKEDVRCVYSGVKGKCCCGCAGKYYYASAYKDESAEVRGYAIREEEVNDKMIEKVVRLMNEGAPDYFEGTSASIEIGKRLYVAHFRINK